jgi:hypothetical protein
MDVDGQMSQSHVAMGKITLGDYRNLFGQNKKRWTDCLLMEHRKLLEHLPSNV